MGMEGGGEEWGWSPMLPGAVEARLGPQGTEALARGRKN